MERNNFALAMEYIYSVEGGFSNHKNDKGGKTNYGITQKTYDSYRKKNGKNIQSVINITKEEVQKIYYTEYWCLSGASFLENSAVALILFDSAVNHGVTAAKQMYQKAGNDTAAFLNLRREKYKNIAEKNPAQKVFYKGWMNRISRLEKFIAENCK